MARFKYDFMNATQSGTRGEVVAANHIDAATRIVLGTYAPSERAHFARFNEVRDSGTRFEGYHYFNHYYKGELSKQIRVKAVK